MQAEIGQDEERARRALGEDQPGEGPAIADQETISRQAEEIAELRGGIAEALRLLDRMPPGLSRFYLWPVISTLKEATERTE